MAILPDLSQLYGEGGGLFGSLPQWLQPVIDDPSQNQSFGRAPDWFSRLQAGINSGQGIPGRPGQFPQTNPPGVPNTAMSSPQGGSGAMLPPNAQPAMQQQPQGADGYYGGSPATNPLLNPAAYGNSPAPSMGDRAMGIAGDVGSRLLNAMNGFAHASGPLPALANGITSLATGRVTDPAELKRTEDTQNKNVTYQALLARGVPEGEARAAMGSPDVLKALLRQTFAPKESGFHIIGYDHEGKAKYGWVGSKPGEITPYDLPKPADDEGSIPANARLMQGLVGDDFLEKLVQVEPGRAALMKKIATGEIPFPSPTFMRSPQGMKLLEDLAQYEPDTDATAFPRRAATVKDFASGKSAQNITSFNTAIRHLDSLDKAVEPLGNRGSSWYNAATQGIANQSNPDYQKAITTFRAAKTALTEELTRAFRGTGGNVHDILEWSKVLDENASPDSLHAGARAAIDLLRGRIDEVGNTYKRGMGKSIDPTELLSPNAKATLERIEEGHKAEAAGELPRPKSIDEAKKLKPGTRFIDPNGAERVR